MPLDNQASYACSGGGEQASGFMKGLTANERRLFLRLSRVEVSAMIMAGRSNLECTILGMLIQLSMANRASPLYLFCLCRVYSNALEFKKGEYIVTF